MRPTDAEPEAAPVAGHVGAIRASGGKRGWSNPAGIVVGAGSSRAENVGALAFSIRFLSVPCSVLDVEGRGRCRALIVGHGAWRADGVRLDSQGETLEGAQRRVRWRLFDKVKGRPVDLLQLFTLR